jgi:sporulation protein YlmC with PRC-barrel domain
MKFKAGASVYTLDGKKVGRIKHFVMTPRTQEVSHLIVERGFLLTEEKVLPLDWIIRTEENGDVILREDKTSFKELPTYEETQYIPREEADESTLTPEVLPDTLYYYGNPGYAPIGYTYPPVVDTQQRYVAKRVDNIPDNSVALNVGAEVMSRDGKSVGRLEEVVSLEDGTATYFLIAKGLFFQTRKLVPTEWITRVDGEHVYLSVSARQLERLPDYDTYNWETVTH